MEKPSCNTSTSTVKPTHADRYRQRSTPSKVKISKSFEKRPHNSSNVSQHIQSLDASDSSTAKKNSPNNSIQVSETESQLLPSRSQVETSSLSPKPKQRSLLLISLGSIVRSAIEAVVMSLRITCWILTIWLFSLWFLEAFRDVVGVDFLSWIFGEANFERGFN